MQPETWKYVVDHSARMACTFIIACQGRRASGHTRRSFLHSDEKLLKLVPLSMSSALAQSCTSVTLMGRGVRQGWTLLRVFLGHWKLPWLTSRYTLHTPSRGTELPVPGTAAKAAEAAKMSRYGDSVRPLAFESFGRLGARSLGTLRDLAALASAASIQPMREAALVRRWRLALETTLLHEKADLLVQSLGGAAAKWCVE